MEEIEKIKEEEEFEGHLKYIRKLPLDKKIIFMQKAMKRMGYEYREEGIPYEEIERMGLNNDPSFMEGYSDSALFKKHI